MKPSFGIFDVTIELQVAVPKTNPDAVVSPHSVASAIQTTMRSALRGLAGGELAFSNPVVFVGEHKDD